MSVYKYYYQRHKFYYIKVRIDGKHISRRFDDSGERFISLEAAKRYESKLLNTSSTTMDNKNIIYVYQLYDPFISYLSERYKLTTVSTLEKAFSIYIYPLIRDKNIKELDSSDIRLINKSINECKRKKVSSLVSVSQNFFKFLSLYDVNLDYNLIVHHKSVSFESVQYKRIWTFDEFTKFINVVDDSYFKLLFLVLFYYGLRISELRGLKKIYFTKEKLEIKYCLTNKNIKKKQTLTSPKSKTSYRSFPMFDFIYDVYLEVLKNPESNNNDFVFYSLKEKDLVIGETTIKRAIKRYSKRAGLTPLTAHEFRHSCASFLINNGMDPLQVAAWMGHASPTITLSVYAHLYEDRKKDIFAFINKKNI